MTLYRQDRRADSGLFSMTQLASTDDVISEVLVLKLIEVGSADMFLQGKFPLPGRIF